VSVAQLEGEVCFSADFPFHLETIEQPSITSHHLMLSLQLWAQRGYVERVVRTGSFGSRRHCPTKLQLYVPFPYHNNSTSMPTTTSSILQLSRITEDNHRKSNPSQAHCPNQIQIRIQRSVLFFTLPHKQSCQRPTAYAPQPNKTKQFTLQRSSFHS